ncbi:hypothetical protein NP493_4735g00004 [Ridgeia piscesae]|uniref:Uncharacterized protein n=1 Tax=Ridgeia piscesae TaxID=27915 RepID=A0AAD9IXG4_RIDPI|nr:hypothetical protein NP493_4735g00004 [Ridgeia piscesae]
MVACCTCGPGMHLQHTCCPQTGGVDTIGTSSDSHRYTSWCTVTTGPSVSTRRPLHTPAGYRAQCSVLPPCRGVHCSWGWGWYTTGNVSSVHPHRAWCIRPTPTTQPSCRGLGNNNTEWGNREVCW